MIAILVSCIGASLLQTSFGSVRIIDLNLAADHQQTIHALMFIPKSASADNKAPLVITCHGGMNSCEMQDAASIELSRRGAVVIAMDAYCHGDSSNAWVDNNFFGQEKLDGLGMIPLVEYATSGILDFVDTSRIAVMGHSLGGHQAENTIRYYGRLYNAAIEEAIQPESAGGVEITAEEQAYADSVNKIYAAFPTGNAPSADAAFWEEVHCNVGYLFTTYDENGYKTSTGSGLITPVSDEALAMINSVLPQDSQVSSVEAGKCYGNREDGTTRVLYQPAMTHPWIHFSTRATADEIEYFTYIFDLDTALGASNQIWNIKEFFNFIGLVGLVLLIVPMAQLLMKVPCFASLAGEEPAKLPALTPKRKPLFWGGIVGLGLVSFCSVIIATPLSNKIFQPAPAAPRRIFLAAFDQNPVLVWAVINGIAALAFFWLVHKFVNRRNGVSDEMIGWKIKGKDLFKTFALAVTIVALIYAIVSLARWAFKTDFRIWTPAFKTFRADKLLPIIGYSPFFFIFYLGNSLLVNGSMRIEGMSEKRNIFLCAAATIWGPTLLWIVQYGTALIRTSNTVMWGDYWMGLLAIFFCIPNLFIATYISRYLFKSTGKVWLGAMVNTLVNVAMTMAATDLFGIFV